jgi:hypothetical protein
MRFSRFLFDLSCDLQVVSAIWLAIYEWQARSDDDSIPLTGGLKRYAPWHLDGSIRKVAPGALLNQAGWHVCFGRN